MDLIAEGIGHAYGDLAVLDGITLEARDGEIVALLGPSGCGKSTLLAILGGLLAPSRGQVSTRGAAPPGCLNPVTYVFQDFALLPWRSVRENVDLPLGHHRLSASERRERVAGALARTGLTDFADAYPKQLSGGMRQRVGIARALAVTPAVLLLDEPLSALDAQTRDLLIEDFIALWDEARTTAVYVTHNLDEALRLADRIVLLSRRPGRIRAEVRVPFPQADRRRDDVRIELMRLSEQLWDTIRTEARAADREVADA